MTIGFIVTIIIYMQCKFNQSGVLTIRNVSMNSKYWYVLNQDRLIVGGAFDTLESASKFARTKPDYFVVSNIGMQYL